MAATFKKPLNRFVKKFRQGLKQSAEDISSALPPLQVQAEKVADNVTLGLHGRRKVGTGETFWNFRPYASGDPTSLIDWRQTAKSKDAYVREKEAEIPQSVWLWRDSSESMDFASNAHVPTKLEYANLLILAISSLLTRAGEEYSFLGANLPLSAGRLAIRRMAQLVDSKRGAEANIKTKNLPPQLELKGRAQLILIGDFLSPPKEIKALLRHMTAQDIQGHLIHLYDPAEKDLPYLGRAIFEDAESKRTHMIRQVGDIQEEYTKRYNEHIALLQKACLNTNWSFQSHCTNEAPEDALFALYSHIADKGDLVS